MSAPTAPARAPLGAVAAACACLAVAGALLGWAIGASPEEMQQAYVALPSLLALLTWTAPAAAVAGLALAWSGAHAWLSRVALAAACGYLGALKVLGFAFLPWLALALVVLAAARTRRLVTPVALLLVHAMGLMSALYLAFNLGRYLAPVAPLLPDAHDIQSIHDR